MLEEELLRKIIVRWTIHISGTASGPVDESGLFLRQKAIERLKYYWKPQSYPDTKQSYFEGCDFRAIPMMVDKKSFNILRFDAEFPDEKITIGYTPGFLFEHLYDSRRLSEGLSLGFEYGWTYLQFVGGGYKLTKYRNEDGISLNQRDLCHNSPFQGDLFHNSLFHGIVLDVIMLNNKCNEELLHSLLPSTSLTDFMVAESRLRIERRPHNYYRKRSYHYGGEEYNEFNGDLDLPYTNVEF